MDELKPCPFCGYNMATEEDVAYQKAGFVGPRTPVWEVCCGSTGCNASVSATSRESAVTAWNTRAASGGDSDSLEQRARDVVVTDAMVDAYLAAQAKAVQEVDDKWGNGGKAASYLHPVREACRAGITAALANQQGVGGG